MYKHYGLLYTFFSHSLAQPLLHFYLNIKKLLFFTWIKYWNTKSRLLRYDFYILSGKCLSVKILSMSLWKVLILHYKEECASLYKQLEWKGFRSARLLPWVCATTEQEEGSALVSLGEYLSRKLKQTKPVWWYHFVCAMIFFFSWKKVYFFCRGKMKWADSDIVARPVGSDMEHGLG